jgi:LssY C-terminus
MLARMLVGSFLILGIGGCASYQPGDLQGADLGRRAVSETQGGVTVSTAMLDSAESKTLFGVDLAANDIQPVWIRIENREDVPYWYAPRFTDPMYFSPAEVAFKSRLWLGGEANQQMAEVMRERELYTYVPPGATVSGFVHTRLDPGSKIVSVVLLSDRGPRTFDFLLEGTDLERDHLTVDFDSLYAPEELREVDDAALLEAIEQMPCCTTDAEGSAPGDPLNFVLIGADIDVLAALVRAGWDETETLSAGSGWRTAWAFLFGSRYRYSPVSPLYLYGRPQDAAFQKARETIDERNHLRLWLTPLRHAGRQVWVGQISRDIGVEFTTRTWNLTTHAIDSDVDAERWYLVQDLLSAQAVERFGFAEGVGVSTWADPRSTLGGDLYFTDGLRAVMFISREPVSFADAEILDWRALPSAAEREQLLSAASATREPGASGPGS